MYIPIVAALSVHNIVALTGAFCVAGSLWFALELPKVRAVMRPIYQEMGLPPDPAAM